MELFKTIWQWRGKWSVFGRWTLPIYMLIVLCGTLFSAEYPQWWLDKGVINTSAQINDYAAANQGQVKWMAKKAYEHIGEYVDPGNALQELILSFENVNNNRPINAGQLKTLAKPFYDRLQELGCVDGYPWTATTADDTSYHIVNIGQVKNMFNFDISEFIAITNYVSTNSVNPTPPYLTWETAAHSIQEALDAVGPNSLVIVSNGTYSTGSLVSPGTDMVSLNRIVIGAGVTVQSFEGPQNTVIQGNIDFSGNTGVRCAYLRENSRLTGFTLSQGGTAWTGPGGQNDYCGGGALCEAESAVVSDCIITGNAARDVGGGIYGGTVEFSTISGNTAYYGGGVGDAVSRNCIIRDNNAYSYDNYLQVYGSGGGAYGGSLRNCLVLGNRSDWGDSGGINNAIVESCTIVGNSAMQFGGVANCAVENSIIYNNSGSDGYNYAPGTVISYSCTEPLAAGEGNIAEDPLFIQTVRGQYDLAVDSPCIDTGHNELWMDGGTDVSGLDRKINGTVDMGAYESQGGSRDLGSMEEIPLEDAAGLEAGAIVSQQTFTINGFRGGWDQLYITSNPYGAGDIHLTGLNIYISINGGTPVVLGGSCSDGYNLTERFPEIDGTVAVTISLVYDGSGAIAADSLSLVKWTPRLTVDWGLSNDYIFVGESFTINLSIPEEPPLPGVPVRVNLTSGPDGAVTFSETPVTLSIHQVTATAAIAGTAVIMVQTAAGAILAQTSETILGGGIVVDSAGSAVKWDDECSGFGDKTEWTAGIKISLQGPSQDTEGYLEITGNNGATTIWVGYYTDSTFKLLNQQEMIVNGEILPEYLNELEIDSRTVKIAWTINNPSHVYPPVDVKNTETEAGANLRIYAKVTQPSELDGTGGFVINASNEGGFSGEVMFYEGKTSIMFDTPVGSGYNPEDFEYKISWTEDSLLSVDGRGPDIVIQYDEFPKTFYLSLNGSSVMMTNAVILYEAVNKVTQNTYCKSIEIPVTQRIDLDVDSDNDGWLSRSPDEDNVEDINSEPGKILFVNNGDSDNDEIPDCGDGFNWDGVAGTSDDLSGAPAFDSMWLELPHDVNISDARLRIQYPLSTPDWDKCVITGTGLNPDVAGTYYRDTGSLNGNFCSNYVHEGNAYRLHCNEAGQWSIQDNTSFTALYTSSSKSGSYMPVSGAGNPYVSSVWEKCPLGNLRIWTKQADVARNYLSVASGGDLVEPGVYYDMSQLGLDAGNPRELYIETVNPSFSFAAGGTISVSMANRSSENYITSDAVRFAALGVEIRAEDGAEPKGYLGLGGTVKYRAVVRPAVPGEYAWTEDGEGITISGATNEVLVTVNAVNGSATVDAEELRVDFTPVDVFPSDDYSASASDVHYMTVIILDSISGYVYGDSGRKIENMQNLSDPVNVVASGYMKFEATIDPSSIGDDLYYKWNATAGTLTDPKGIGNSYLEVKWDAPDGHEQDVTVTLEVKESTFGPTICTKTLDLKTIRPYVVRVKFVDDQQIADGCDPEFDSIEPASSFPVCYVKNTCLHVRLDIAGDIGNDNINDLTKNTQIHVTGKLYYDSAERGYLDEDSIDDDTEDWSMPDYSTVDILTEADFPDEVTEFEDFSMRWIFKVKDSSGNWIIAYEDTSGCGYSHETTHNEDWPGIEELPGTTFGLYLIYNDHQFSDDTDFTKLTLDYACDWADGKNTPEDICNSFINNGFSKYKYDANCHELSASFVHACLSVGLDAKQHVWTCPKNLFDGKGLMAELYDGPNNSWNNNDTFFMKSSDFIDPLSESGYYEWKFHAWAESGSKIYDPSAAAEGGDGAPSSESWGAYEDVCFDEYRYVTDAFAIPSSGYSAWVGNPDGQSTGFNDEGVHVFHFEYDDRTPDFPVFLKP